MTCRARPLITGLMAVALVSACAQPPSVSTRQVPLDNFLRTQAESAVNETLPNPDSSFYRMSSAFQTAEGDYVVCGEVNARNKLGGYQGFTPFYVRFSTDRRRVKTRSLQIDRFLAPEVCAQAAGGAVSTWG